MPTIHFLNVKQGDCAFIQHNSGHITVLDVFNASKVALSEQIVLQRDFASSKGNFNQKDYPINPIQYMKNFNVSSIFRFILTHPDMDHLGGIKDLFETFPVENFWDTDNKKEMGSFEGSPYSEEDWKFYKGLRDGTGESPKRLTYYSGSKNKYFNLNEDGKSGGDGLYVLSPTSDLVKDAIKSGDYNDCSYVLLYKTGSRKILFGGDSGEKTWEHILEKHKDDVTDIDVLFAPHHGRKLESYEFLNVLNPKISYFGNANSQHLAYNAWNYRNLPFITNNQANCIITDINGKSINVYVTNENFARSMNKETYNNANFNAWFLTSI